MEKKPLVLIVDDQASARHTLEALLLKEDYDLAFAVSGRDALECLGRFEPDVILLDVMLPVMDGFEVCKRIKADEARRHIPVILITALETKQALAPGIEAGADDFISKPVSGFELRARVRSMLRIKGQYDKLERNLRSREELASMIAHDMRNPLTIISGVAEVLRHKFSDPEVLRSIETMRTEAHRLNTLLNDMLMLAKMEAGKPVLNQLEVDMNRFVDAVVGCQRVVAQARGIDLEIDLPEESRQVSLDGNLFRRVFDNLISNALEYTPSGSTVTVRIEYPEEQEPSVRVQVLDEGPGIPEEYREKIFEKYEVAELKKKEGFQLGLGLAFSKMVVDAHGGRIFAGPNEPKGSVFTVEL